MTLDLDALEEMHLAAEPPPWTATYACVDAAEMHIYDEGGHGPAEAALIAAARNALPELIRRARRAERLEKAAQMLLANLDEHATGAFGGEDELRAALEEEAK